MKINAIKFYTIIFIIVIFLQLYVYSFRTNIFIQLFVLILYYVIEKPTFSILFFKKVLPIILLFLIGFIGTTYNKYHLFNIVKDIFHFIKPVFAIFIGFLFYKKINDFKLFVKSIVIIGFISTLIHYFILTFLVSNFDNVATIRAFGTDNFIELCALFFLSYYKRFQGETLFKSILIHNILLISLLISCFLYFSRTMIVMAVLALLTIYGYTIITRKTIKIISIFITSILFLYIILFSVNIQRNKPGIESFLYKVKNAPAEVFKTRIDRENHADLWDHWRGYEAKRAFDLLNENPISYVIGCGYGSLVNLRFYAPLSKDKKGMKYISELHNGYMYILYKTGLIGILLYFYFLVNLYKKIYCNKNYIVHVFMSIIGLSFIFTTLVTVGINNSNEALLFIIGALFYFEEKQQKLSLND